MTPVVGVDGCPAGWIAVLWAKNLELRMCSTFDEVLSIGSDVVAVDMPIGFLTIDVPGGRLAEQQVRVLLSPKTSRVFPAPSRATIEARPSDQRSAGEINKRNSSPQKSIGAQTFGIIKKMSEIDCLMSAELQSRVYEAHPEASFAAMNGNQPILQSKKTPEGHLLRKQVLAGAGFPVDKLPPHSFRRKDVALDDLMDACACAWTARRILERRSMRYPSDPPYDSKGLRMEINV